MTVQRAGNLMENYNNILTRNEDQKTSEYRKQTSDSTKPTVMQDFKLGILFMC